MDSTGIAPYEYDSEDYPLHQVCLALSFLKKCDLSSTDEDDYSELNLGSESDDSVDMNTDSQFTIPSSISKFATSRIQNGDMAPIISQRNKTCTFPNTYRVVIVDDSHQTGHLVDLSALVYDSLSQQIFRSSTIGAITL